MDAVKGPSRPRGSVVLLSGGMDSATCLALASRDAPPVHALTVGYGQRHVREIRSARAIARHYRVARHTVLDLPLGPLLDSSLTRRARPLPRAGGRPGRIPSTYVPARNTILLAVALGYAESHRLGSIFIGANAIDYSGYPDCRPPFLRAFERVARLGTRTGVETGRGIRIRAPLLRLSKERIVRLGERLGVPWQLTWSCYAGGRVPCTRCDACRLRSRGFAKAGVRDPTAA
ncbi:MAG TPA: 7-cyano-7-deazaguanine synthase QueC [Thermoplasmata archaeon]|nr:7-cyano-7-deazaguanine synthase QueC [Thermoplasmata archaeon]